MTRPEIGQQVLLARSETGISEDAERAIGEAALRAVRRQILREAGERRRTLSAWACVAGMVLALMGPAVVFLVAWAHRADCYPVLDVLDLMRGFWRAEAWAVAFAAACLAVALRLSGLALPRVRVQRAVGVREVAQDA